jgi:hypothetical protein
MVYKKLRINISEKQVLQALKGKPIRLTASQVNSGDTFVSLHPANAKKVEKAFLSKKGVSITLSHGELLETASDMNGSGFWGNVWDVIKKGWGALKKSGLLTAAADAAVAPLASYTGQPAAVAAGRKLLKDVAGVGINQTQVARKRMTKQDKYAQLRGSGIYLS